MNRSFVNTYLEGTKTIGYHLRGPNAMFFPVSEIRGIAADAREQGIQHPPVPTVYRCVSAPGPDPYFLIRTRTEPMAMAETLRRKIHEIEPNRAVFGITSLEQRLSDTFAQERLRTVLLASFAGAAIMLACVGLYGTLSYVVSLRRREVGLRLALGALRGQIVRRFLSQAMAVAASGCAAGVVLGAAFTRALSGMLFGVSPLDIMTFSAVIAIVLAVAGAASFIPALRAGRLEPMLVLRDD